MRFLVFGSGGREHAIVKALKTSKHTVDVIPGNAGMGQDANCHGIALDDVAAILKFIGGTDFDCAVIGPEAPLADGLADELRGAGLAVFGPAQAAARLEASKIFAKKFMIE